MFQQETVKGPEEAHHLPRVFYPGPQSPIAVEATAKHGTDSCHDSEMQKPLLTYFQETKALAGISHVSI